MHYYQFNIADYRKDTVHLTPMEHYIYRTLIDWYYLDELPIPNDLPLIIRRLSVAEGYIQQLQNVLNDFFILQEAWYHQRIEDEITAYKAQIEHASKAGKASAEARAKKNKTNVQQLLNTRSTDVQPTNNHKPITTNHKIHTPDGVALTLWSDFLILRRAKKLPITNTALDGIKREADKAGITLNEAITICCERGWGGFKADWLKAEAVAKEKENQAWRTDDTLMMQKAKEFGVSTTGKSRYEVIAAIDKKRGAL
jgi:uncharacterized protein YdaU (DUF1376 family)